MGAEGLYLAWRVAGDDDDDEDGVCVFVSSMTSAGGGCSGQPKCPEMSGRACQRPF